MNIQESIKARGVKHGGVEMFRVADAIAIVEECRRRKQPILGLDAFSLTSGETRPLMEKSVDLSSRSKNGASHDLAVAHLKRFEKDNLWFEVVF